MTKPNPIFAQATPSTCSARQTACKLLLPFIGIGFLVQAAHAQTTAYQNSQFSNVEVRHTPNVSVWPKTTRAANGTGRIPPTIIHGKNGVTAVLNPSWFSKSVAKKLASGKEVVICDDGTRVHSHAAKAHRVAPKKTGRATR